MMEEEGNPNANIESCQRKHAYPDSSPGNTTHSINPLLFPSNYAQLFFTLPPALRLHGQILRGLGSRALGGNIRAGHAPIDHKVRAVHEAALVAGEEQDCLRLLDGLAEAARGEVDLAAVALGEIVSEPVLEEGRAGRV